MTKPVKILVIEDDQDLRDIYQALFSRDPRFVVRCTQDGAHGAALLRTEAFDVAIIDIRLPNMNGLQVAAIARSSQLNRNVPIFIISGSIDASSASRARAFSRAVIIEKPFDSDALLRQVQALTTPKAAPKGYDVRIINAVLGATTSVFEFYFDEGQVKVGKPGIRQGSGDKRNGITGLISIGGETFAGSLALVTETKLIQALGAKLFQTGDAELDQVMIADIMGEMCNQVCGKIKSAFGAIGLKAIIGLPEVVTGSDHVVHHKVESTILFVPVHIGQLICAVEFCLVERSGFKIDEEQGEASVSGAVIF